MSGFENPIFDVEVSDVEKRRLEAPRSCGELHDFSESCGYDQRFLCQYLSNFQRDSYLAARCRLHQPRN